MKLHYVLALALPNLVASCVMTSVHGPKYAGGDGSSPETAVVVLRTKTEQEFTAAETAWLGQNLPGYRLESGSYVLGAGAHHVVKVLLADGSRRTVYFDMSGFGR
jgi:hypothetical protein